MVVVVVLVLLMFGCQWSSKMMLVMMTAMVVCIDWHSFDWMLICANFFQMKI